MSAVILRRFAVTAKGCESMIPGFEFGPGPVDLGFIVTAKDWLEARYIVASALLEEGLMPDKLVKSREVT